MGWDQGRSHQRQQIFAVLLSLAVPRVAWADNRLPEPSTRIMWASQGITGTVQSAVLKEAAQSPDPRWALVAVDDLDKALQAARIDERTSAAIITIVNLLPENSAGGFTDRKSGAQAIS